MLVNLQIIGVQKAGTTALASFLNQHPDIYVVEGKEAHVFDHPNFYLQANKSHFVNKQYNARLKHYADESFICDATPITIFHPTFLNDCYQYNTQAKFIVVLRDPVERALSHYHMSRKIEAEKRPMLMAFLLEGFRLKKVTKQDAWPFDSPFRTQSYLRRGLYSRQLEQLYATIPKEQVLVMMQSDLQHHHQKAMHRIFEFLDIPKANISPEVVFNTARKFTHWTDPLARIFARLYYRLHNESAKKWHDIIHRSK